MSKMYRVNYTSDGVPHTKFLTALDKGTAISMFLEEVDRHRITVDDSSTVDPVLVKDDSDCSKSKCVCGISG